ncbi:Uncharacterised protein [Salmonella enterica subsp. enterica serovar Bovismorbificans]|uniref:Uncharacterized protein n=1 Tax=Salmonella enterica subsp. enterica serovar Bovismorbificans TaxID=58097 RepID=A0A655ER49_SALET|nr:Uncharacterised protein [Salmonella enterica subsp. enterica serovar Bovismorbificans]
MVTGVSATTFRHLSESLQWYIFAVPPSINARIIARSVVLAGRGVISPLGPKTSEPVSVITNSFSSLLPSNILFLDKAFHMMLIFLVTRSLSLSLALSLTLSDWPPTVHPCRDAAQSAKILLSPAMSWQTFCWETCVFGKSPPTIPCAAWQELRFMLLMSEAIFCRKSLAVLISGTVVCSARSKKYPAALLIICFTKRCSCSPLMKLNEPR